MFKKKIKEGWFHTPGRIGDRTIAQQLIGLDALMAEVRGKSVLDVGCAEGLISIECARAGALYTHGVEIIGGHLDVGNAIAVAEHLPCTFEQGDANTWQSLLPRSFDVLLLLSILHKLRDPGAACARLVESCRDLCVVRLPPLFAPVIIDWRSNDQPVNIQHVMAASGFELTAEFSGPFDEWTGYFRRSDGRG